MEQIQYQPTNIDRGYNPVTPVNLQPGLDNQSQIFKDDERRATQAGQLDTANRIFNAKSAGKDMEALSKFSKTLADYLVEEQKKKNQEDMERGIMLAYYEGVPEQEQAEFEAGEQQLTEAKAQADRLGEQVEEQTGDVFVADRFRSLSGWERYGYAQGLVQRGAANFSTYYAEAKQSAQISVDGQIVTFENASTPEEFAALQAQIVQQFLGQYAGVNPALLNKHLFPTVQQITANDAINFAKEQRDLRQQELLAERSNTVIGIVSNPNSTPEQLSEFIVNHPKGPSKGKFELAAILEQGLKDGTIKGEDVLRLLDTEYTDVRGTGTLAGKDPSIFGPLRNLAEDAIAGEIDRETRQLAGELKQVENDILKSMSESDGIYTSEEIRVIIDTWNARTNNAPLPDSIKDRFTANLDTDLTEARIRLREIQAERGYLTEADFKGYPDFLRNEFNVRTEEEMTPSSRDLGQATKAITAGLDTKFNVTQGDAPRSEAYRQMERAALRDYERLYAQYINDGRSPTEAHEAALGMVQQRLDSGTPFSETSRSYYEQPLDTSASQNTTDRLNTHRELIAKDRSTVSTVKYLSISEMEEGIEYLKGNSEAPPSYAVTLARSLGIPTYDLIAMQAQAHGIEYKEERPPVEGEVDGLDPGIQQLLRFKPSNGRTMRAVTQTDGDTKWFLDQVASVESKAHGEYDAMNTGGSGIGPSNTAYGSANSCDVTGCLSSMTVGEVMNLQGQGRVFAAGRYQFIPATLREMVQLMQIPLDAPFDATTQDALALGRLHWRLSRQNSLNGLRTEWQGFWKIPAAEAQKVLDVARGIVSLYNRPENILPALRGK